jgi:L-2-amino-thiazoline-4-carboxylic acid hydrolase-like protein
MSDRMPPDNLNDIGVLKRREIEARILMPVLSALGDEFGRERVFEIARRIIVDVAREQGRGLAERMGGDSLGHFATALEDWKKGDAYRMDVLEQNDQEFSFNVTRCRYAEMYRALGIPEVGALLSCNRDFALVEGFNPDVKLTRTQTVMEGASHCDFRFVLRKSAHDAKPTTDGTKNAMGGPGGGATPLPPS